MRRMASKAHKTKILWRKKKWHARQLAVAAEIDSRKWHQQYYRFALLLGC
jgi:hypothetical protein